MYISKPEFDDCPSTMDLAAYHDRRMNADDAIAIQSHVAACPTCQDALRDLEEAAGAFDATMVYVPSQVIERAMALVRTPANETERLNRTLTFARRAAAVAASLAVGAVGFQVGGNLASPHQLSAIDAQSEYFFGLFEDHEQDQIAAELFWFDSAEASS